MSTLPFATLAQVNGQPELSLEGLSAEHLRAWNEGRYTDCVYIIARIRKLRGMKSPTLPLLTLAEVDANSYQRECEDERDFGTGGVLASGYGD